MKGEEKYNAISKFSIHFLLLIIKSTSLLFFSSILTHPWTSFNTKGLQTIRCEKVSCKTNLEMNSLPQTILITPKVKSKTQLETIHVQEFTIAVQFRQNSLEPLSRKHKRDGADSMSF